MLYQKGEKLKVLKETINTIPELSELNKSDFIMSNRELKKFETPIIKLFKELNDVLFSTLIKQKESNINKTNVYNAVDKIVLYLQEHYKHDLVDYFYEEKLAIYENLFVILVRDNLCIKYPEYKGLLEFIPKTYWQITESYEEFFPKISQILEVHDNITNDMQSQTLYSSTFKYLEHSLEMIYEELSKCIKVECKKKFLNPDVLPNLLRLLIYLLKCELPIAFEPDEDNEKSE